MKGRVLVASVFCTGMISAVWLTATARCQEPIDPVPIRIEPITVPIVPIDPVPITIDPPIPVSPPIRIDPPIKAPPPVRILPPAGGGSPPPPPRQLTYVPIPLPQPWDDEERYLEKLIQRYNGDEGLRSYFASVQKARELWNTAEDLVFAITAVDAHREIAKLVVERLEKEAVAVVHQRLESQLARLKANVYNWSDTQAHRERALAEIHQHERWLNRVTQEALSEANSRVNQSPTAHDSSTQETHITISDSSSATTSHIQLQEGTAMRQLRDVNSNAWSGVLNWRL